MSASSSINLHVAGLLLLCAPGLAGAQPSATAPGMAGTQAADPAAGPTAVALPELIVSGERVTRSVAATAASVAVTTAPDLAGRQLRDLSQVIRATPNTSISDDNREVVIRGIPATGLAAVEDVLTLTPGAAVTTFLDGVPISTWGGATSTWDIDRIEVFRGPQTTVSGRGSLAGAVFLNSADPTRTWTGAVRAGGGTQGSTGFSGVVSGPLVDDRLGIRVSIDRQENQGFIKNITTGQRQNPDRHLTARAKALYDDGTTRVTLSYTHSDRTRGSGLASLAQWPGRSVNVGNIPERLHKIVDVGSLAFSHSLSGAWKVEGLTALGREDAQRELDGDVTALDLLRVNVVETVNQVSQELRLVYAPPEGRLTGFIGAYGRAFDRDTRTDLSGLLSLSTRTKQDNTTVAAFGETTYAILPVLRLTLGGRVEAESFKSRFTSNAAGPASASGDVVVPLPRVQLAFDVAPNVTLFGTVQRAYRAGGAQQTQISGTAYTFDPEFAWNYEVALRTQWLGGRLEVNLNAFHTKLTRQQVEQRTGLGNPLDSSIVNAGRSTQNGVELESRYRLTESLTGFFNAGLLETRFDRFVTADGDFSGNRFPFAPNYSVGTGAVWHAPAAVTLSSEVNLQGPAFSDIQNTRADKLGARAIVNLVASKAIGPLVASVFVRNLLDEAYATRKVTAFDLVAPGPRRFVGAELRGFF